MVDVAFTVGLLVTVGSVRLHARILLIWLVTHTHLVGFGYVCGCCGCLHVVGWLRLHAFVAVVTRAFGCYFGSFTLRAYAFGCVALHVAGWFGSSLPVRVRFAPVYPRYLLLVAPFPVPTRLPQLRSSTPVLPQFTLPYPIYPSSLPYPVPGWLRSLGCGCRYVRCVAALPLHVPVTQFQVTRALCVAFVLPCALPRVPLQLPLVYPSSLVGRLHVAVTLVAVRLDVAHVTRVGCSSRLRVTRTLRLRLVAPFCCYVYRCLRCCSVRLRLVAVTRVQFVLVTVWFGCVRCSCPRALPFRFTRLRARARSARLRARACPRFGSAHARLPRCPFYGCPVTLLAPLRLGSVTLPAVAPVVLPQRLPRSCPVPVLAGSPLPTQFYLTRTYPPYVRCAVGYLTPVGFGPSCAFPVPLFPVPSCLAFILVAPLPLLAFTFTPDPLPRAFTRNYPVG